METKKTIFCEFCGEEEATYKDHYEEHVDPPRRVNIGMKCHGKLHYEKLIRKPMLETEGKIRKLEARLPKPKISREPFDPIKLFNELMEHASKTRCACEVCHQLREAYYEELKSKIPEV